MAHRLVRGLRGAAKVFAIQQQSRSQNHHVFRLLTRSYIADMRKSAFEGNILRLIRNEIQYEHERSPQSESVPEFNSFTVNELPGEQWVRLTKKFGENEEIKVDVTMFDGSIPVQKDDGSEDEKFHITLIVDIVKGENNDVLEFVCSAWPESIEIRHAYTRRHNQMRMQPHTGPQFSELSDELQDSLYSFLEERGVDEKLAQFLHQYIKSKDKNEYLRWMENLKSFIQKK